MLHTSCDCRFEYLQVFLSDSQQYSIAVTSFKPDMVKQNITDLVLVVLLYKLECWSKYHGAWGKWP